MLVLSRKQGQCLMIGEDIEIKIVEISGNVVKIGIEAPKDVQIHRKEVFDAIKSENIEAASKNIISLSEFAKRQK